MCSLLDAIPCDYTPILVGREDVLNGMKVTLIYIATCDYHMCAASLRHGIAHVCDLIRIHNVNVW